MTKGKSKGKGKGKVTKVLRESKNCRIVVMERDEDETPLAPATRPIATNDVRVVSRAPRPKDTRKMEDGLFAVKPVDLGDGRTKWAVFAKDFGGEVLAANVYPKKKLAEEGLETLKHSLATCNGRVAQALKGWQGASLDLPYHVLSKMEKLSEYHGTYDGEDEGLLNLFDDDFVDAETPLA